jgi:hypothetical protein
MKPESSRTVILAARLPVHFLAMAAVFFAGGAIALPFVTASIAGFFYQPAPLAVTHAFTLGWLTPAIMGVMYRIVPALTHRQIRYPRIALAQCIMLGLGASGMIAHFAIGVWYGTWLAGIVILASISMFAFEMIPSLWPRRGAGTTETGLLIAVMFLVLAGLLGFTLAFDKSFDFLAGSVLTNLGSHVHLAAIGWATMAICAVSYRMMSAFLLPARPAPPRQIWQLYTLACGTLGLSISLLLGIAGAIIWAAVIAMSLAWYLFAMCRMIATRRASLDWTTRHAIAALTWLAAAILLGTALAREGAQSELGARIASAYGIAGIIGFASNFIIGMSYRISAGIVTHARSAAGWAVVTIDEISISKMRPFVFFGFNGGAVALSIGFLTGGLHPAIAGAVGIALCAAVYSCSAVWTLSFGYRQAGPQARSGSFRVLLED